jgi:hypothetical protein
MNNYTEYDRRKRELTKLNLEQIPVTRGPHVEEGLKREEEESSHSERERD